MRSVGKKLKQKKKQIHSHLFGFDLVIARNDDKEEEENELGETNAVVHLFPLLFSVDILPPLGRVIAISS